MQMLSVLIVSEIRLYRDGLAELLAPRDRLRVIGTAAHLDEALQKTGELNPSVLVLDLALPEALRLSRMLMQSGSDLRVIALGVPENEESVLALAEAGVTGYIPGNGSVQDLVDVIEQAVRGELRCTPQFAGAILRRLAWRAATKGDLPRSPLTMRESEIVRLIDEGLSNKEIAVRLGIEVATVKNHVHNLLEKLRVHRRAQAASCLRGRDPRRSARRELLRE